MGLGEACCSFLSVFFVSASSPFCCNSCLYEGVGLIVAGHDDCSWTYHSLLCSVEGGPLGPTFGFPAFSGIARLTWLVELFGNLCVTAATLEEDPEKNYSKMTAKLKTSSDR